MGCGASRDEAAAQLMVAEPKQDETPASANDQPEEEVEELKMLHEGIVAQGPKAAAVGPPKIVAEEAATVLGNLPECLSDLHDGMPPAIQQAPMRLLRIKAVLTWTGLKVFEEVDKATECLQLPYMDTDDELWKKVVTVSWRWALQKPQVYKKDFSPMSDVQFQELTALLRIAEERGLEFVWIDWSCVPQYGEDSMVEVHRSKVFYARSRAMRVLPNYRNLPVEGPVRLILVKAKRALGKKAEMGSLRSAVAAEVIAAILAKNTVAARDYFGRVWTLAERMARHGRGEGLCQWLSLESWLGMVVDAMLKAMEDKAASQIYKKMLGQSAAGLLDAVLEPLAAAMRTGSVQAKASIGLEFKVAELCQAAVSVWLSPSLLAEAPTSKWLHTYLGEEARSGVYQAWSEADRVWAIYSYFCWKSNLDQRSAEGLRTALDDLVEIAAGERRVYLSGMFAQLGIDDKQPVVSPVVPLSPPSSNEGNSSSKPPAARKPDSASRASSARISSARKRQEEQEAAAAAAAERRRQEEEAALSATARRKQDEIAAAAAAAERRKQEEAAAAAAAERRKQEEAAAIAAATARRQQEEAAAVAASERRKQEEAAAAAAAERRKQEEAAAAAAKASVVAAAPPASAGSATAVTYTVGQRVTIKNVSVDEARNAMNGHGGWANEMADYLGKYGAVESVDSDGDVKVKMDHNGDTKLWNPVLLIPSAPAMPTAGPISTGKLVGIKVMSVADAKSAMNGHGGWADAMTKMIGKLGIVESLDKDGDVRVKMCDGSGTMLWNPSLVVPIAVGTKVVIAAATVDAAKTEMSGHGGWADAMTKMLGKPGTVESIDKDNDVRVTMDDGSGTMLWNASLVTLPGSAASAIQYTVGMRVLIKNVSADEARNAMNGHGGWANEMADFLGMAGIVESVDSDGDVKVKMCHVDNTKLWNPVLLMPLVVGTRVCIRSVTVDAAKSLQNGHGGWANEMANMLGKNGVVESVDKDYDMKVKMDDSSLGTAKLWSPALLCVPGTKETSSPAAAAAPAAQFSAGMRVLVKNVPVDEARNAMNGHGGWANEMADFLGKAGIVESVDSDGDVKVKMCHVDNTKLWSPVLLMPLVVGTKVGIRSVTVDAAKALQNGHGGWANEMANMLGKNGVVESVDKDYDMKVKMDDSSLGTAKLWSPALLCTPWPSSAPAAAIAVGTKVMIRQMTAAEAQEAQKDHGGWNSGMANCIGKLGVVTYKWADGDVKVKMDDGTGEYCWNKTSVVLPTAAAATSTCTGSSHRGVWRGPETKYWCSTPSMTEGTLCTHDGGIIKAPHWSCCGAKTK